MEPNKRTVRDIKEIWAFLLNGENAFVITRLIPERATFRWAAISNNHASANFQEEITDHIADPTKLVPARAFMTDVQIERNGSADSYFAVMLLNGGRTDDPHVRFGRQALISVETRSFSIELLPGVLKNVGLPSQDIVQRNRVFESVFRNFGGYSRGLESLTLEELRAYLDRLSKEKGQDVELYGAKIPQRAISTWGIVVILMLQAYLLSHLTQLKYHDATVEGMADYPWIAFYTDTQSRIVTFASLMLAPITIGALALSGWHSLQSHVVRISMVLGIGLSTALAICNWQRIRKCPENVRLIRKEAKRAFGE